VADATKKENIMVWGAFKVAQVGTADVMEWVAEDVGAPGADQIRLRHEAIGVNYIDVYHRTGVYPLPLPTGLGVEGAGIVEEIGSAVTHLSPGDRVVYAGGPPGAYSDVRLLPAARAVRIPARISSETAAALFFKGLTAQYLTRSAFPVQAGQWALVHAAAGGVGLIACQWLIHLGAKVIGVVSTEAKADLVRSSGVEHVIVDQEGAVAPKVRTIAPDGVDVVYDSVGKTTFSGSLESLKVRGMLVGYGVSSGPAPANDGSIFGTKGSLYYTRPSIAHYMATRAQLEAGAADLFEVLAKGIVKPERITRYALKDARQAHRDLESRRTTGSLVLVP
jgi:NADPH2:quinone reductase